MFPMSSRLSSFYSILLYAVLASLALGAPTPVQHQYAQRAVSTTYPMNGPRTRATWVWNTADVVANATETNNFIAFAQKNQLNRVYVHIDQYVLPSDFRTFVYKCSRTGSGVAVEALIGDPQWILQINTASMASRLQWVQKYQASVGGNVDYQIKGLHLDIEVCRDSLLLTDDALSHKQ